MAFSTLTTRFFLICRSTGPVGRPFNERLIERIRVFQSAGPAIVAARSTSAPLSTALDVMQPPCETPSMATRSDSA